MGLNIDDRILEKEITIKLSIRQILQIAVISMDAKGPNNQCQAIYDRLIQRLQRLPLKTQTRFIDFADRLFEQLPPEWPEEFGEEIPGD